MRLLRLVYANLTALVDIWHGAGETKSICGFILCVQNFGIDGVCGGVAWQERESRLPVCYIIVCCVGLGVDLV